MEEEKSKIKEKSNPDGDDEEESTNSGESLLTLVQPEMNTLSNHWLAALRDHAMLCLPAGKFFLSVLSNL